VSKKYWLLFIFLIIVIALLAASYFVEGFDTALAEGWHNIVIVNLANFTSGVVAHPVFQVWGYHLMYFAGGITVILLAWLLWPSLKNKMPAKPLTGLQTKVSSSVAQVIPKVPSKTVIPKVEVAASKVSVAEPEVEAEE